MSIFSSIKDAIFGHKAAAAEVPPPPTDLGTDQPVPQSAPTSDVDVAANLEQMGQGKHLNWRSSIVDLMKLLGIDSSLDNRKSLAQELGYTGALDGSAEMNIWLHKATMRKLSENGGNVPADMLD